MNPVILTQGISYKHTNMFKKICSQDTCSMTHDFLKDSDVIDFCLFVLMIFGHQGNLLNIFVISLCTKVTKVGNK